MSASQSLPVPNWLKLNTPAVFCILCTSTTFLKYSNAASPAAVYGKYVTCKTPVQQNDQNCSRHHNSGREGLLSFPIVTKQAHMQEDEEQQQQVEKR